MRFVKVAAVAILAALPMAGCSMIQGDQSAGQYADDAALTARVKAALLDDEQVAGTSINVNVYNGEVTLAGFADTEAQRQRAAEIARQVPGVKSVESNSIRVASAEDPNTG